MCYCIVMTIKTHISFTEYARLLYTLAYRKPFMWLIVAIGAAMWFWIISYYSGWFGFPKPSIYQYITAVLITVIQPAFIFLTIWQNYHSSAHLQESMVVEFTQDLVKLTGKSFYTELGWKRLFRILELKNWYLIYQNNLSAVIIPKKSFGKKCAEFQRLLQAIPGIPKKLKIECN